MRRCTYHALCCRWWPPSVDRLPGAISSRYGRLVFRLAAAVGGSCGGDRRRRQRRAAASRAGAANSLRASSDGDVDSSLNLLVLRVFAFVRRRRSDNSPIWHRRRRLKSNYRRRRRRRLHLHWSAGDSDVVVSSVASCTRCHSLRRLVRLVMHQVLVRQTLICPNRLK